MPNEPIFTDRPQPLPELVATRNFGSRRRRCGYVIFATMKRAACRFGRNETNSMKGASGAKTCLLSRGGEGAGGGLEGRMTTFPSSSSSSSPPLPSPPLLLSLNIYSYFFKEDCGAVSCRVCLAEEKSTNADDDGGTNECLRVNTPLGWK